jgi:hypothetical protein
MARAKPPQDVVAELLSTLKMHSIDDFDMERIAAHLGVEVRRERLDGCAANIVGVGDHAIVSVDQASTFGHQRFSIGHELGHWVYDKGRDFYLCSNADLNIPWSERSKTHLAERRANRFAAELLMPRAWFRDTANNRQVSFDTVEVLRKLFQTSRTATAIRLVELGAYLSMLIKYDDRGQRRWYVASQDFPEGMYPHRAADRESQAWDAIFRSSALRTTIQEVDGDVWLDHPTASEILVVEQAMRVRDGFLVLIAIEDETTLLEVLEEE